MYHYTESGLDNIWLVNGVTSHKTVYGDGVSFKDIDGLHKAISFDLVHHKPRLSGKEFRFIRTELDMSQHRLGEWIGTTDQAVARWEKGKTKVPKWADRLIRAIYRERVEGSANIADIINRMNELDQKEWEERRFELDHNWKQAA